MRVAGAKGPDAFRTISEASAELGVPQHVLRFWETKFSFIRPMKRAGGRRFYRRQDIAMLQGVRSLLHDQGYTIKGVQRLHREEGMRRLLATGSGEASAKTAASAAPPLLLRRPVLGEAAQARLWGVLADLEGTKARLDALLAAGDDS